MKNMYLSNFQKEQYTEYLESQLQKFSAFMLAQKKQNQNLQHFQSIIQSQSQSISDLSQKVRMLEVYQRQNFRQCERVENSIERAADLEHRLVKVESVYFERPRAQQNQRNKINEGSLAGEVENFKKDVVKKFKQMENEIKKLSMNLEKQIVSVYKNKDNSPLRTKYSDVQSVQNTEVLVTRKQLKMTEENIHQFFDRKFNKIEKMVRRSLDQSHKMLIQQQTFGINEEYDDYKIAQSQVQVTDKSYCNSQSNTVLKPVQYFSQKSKKSEREHKKSKRLSKSKSLPRQKSKSVRSRSISHSKSKSIKNKSKHMKLSLSKKATSPAKQVSTKQANQYKRVCKKKHH